MHLKSDINTLSLRDTLVAKFQKNARSNIILKISIWSIGILAVFGIGCMGSIGSIDSILSVHKFAIKQNDYLLLSINY